MRLRIQNRQSSSPPVILTLEISEDSTFESLIASCYEKVPPQAAKHAMVEGWNGGKAKLDKALKASSLAELSISPVLMAGFPPSKLAFTPSTKVSELLKSGEAIDVRWVCSAEAPPSGKRKKGGASSTAASSKRTKKKKGATSSSTTTSSPPDSPPQPPPPPASMSTSNAAASRRMAKMSGHTLSGGEVPSSVPPPRAAAQKRGGGQRQISLGSNTTDVTESLLGSLSGGSSNKAMKGAVSKTYEVSKSVDRVAAVLFSIELNKKALHPSPPPPLPYPTDPSPPTLTSLPDARKKVKFAPSLSASSTSGPGTFDVSFFKPTGGTAAITDSAVTILDLETLKAVINHVMEGGDGDMLDINTTSLVSLRVFWSIYFHFPFHHPHQVLQSWHPSLASLDVRKRELSEKAKDNEAQERGDDDREEQAVGELLDLEDQIVKGVEEGGWKERKRRAADAAIARLGGDKATEWDWTVDSTEDEDELRECLGEGNEGWVGKLREAGAHNWVMLATATLSEGMAGEDAVLGAVGAARLKTVEEIMMSIVDGEEGDYEGLLRARSATPFDLMNWEGEEELLVEELGGKEVGIVREWVRRAKKVYEKDGMGWLGGFVC
ncbi:hypothetical protein TrRE_jg6231 [Triparma retinervis]|uniref:Uncharacterized protein n=1 Tax=Triparma retinervis TaxID=2557542 RepID=A0A9W7EB57_9STRA|nr:hypothetical protein TrRE_jg6231 [Triparma retinervis]